MKNKKTVGNRFKEWRLENEWTQAQLGEKLNLSNNFLSEVEHDKTNLGLHTIKAMGINHQLNLDWLLVGRGEMLSPK